MRKRIFIFSIITLLSYSFGLSFASEVFAQHKTVFNSASVNSVNARNLSACTRLKVSGELPKSVNIPQQLCADEKKSADFREIVKPGNGGENLLNHTINNTDLVFGGMSADVSFSKLPIEVRRLIKLTFPDIAADRKQLYSLMIVGEDFPSAGRFAKFVRNYKYTLQNSNAGNQSAALPYLPTWSFVRQNGKLKLRYLEILTWNADEKTYN